MPRPEVKMVKFTIDGREVEAPEGMMLADAALEYGETEIPVFCYDKKLGPPVGACRMCLVEIEGMGGKLQAGCSVPVREGLEVKLDTPEVKSAQEAVLEFILINHPLDCPVCDKGGECPLQDQSFGWGGGLSRFVEPKRHFEKPLALSPLVAIDRERCILCYRCVRYSQEVAEDYQLVLEERGSDTYVTTFDGHPYVAPFSGNIIELCPVGALTSRPYRFRARPWDIEQAGTICTLCPAQCNVSLTVRDERVLRVLQRDHEEVDDGWLCDKGRFAYQAIHVDERVTTPMLRDGGELRPVTWELAIETAVAALRRSGEKTGALVGGETSNEEGLLLGNLMREALGSFDLDSRPGGELPLGLLRALGEPDLQAGVTDLQDAHAVLVLDCEPVDDIPILDLRLRKPVRHHGVKLFMATDRPSSLDERATASVRYAPGCGGAFAAALDLALSGSGDLDALSAAAAAAGSDGAQIRALADSLKEAGDEVVILWGERLTAGERGADSARALLNLADRLQLSGKDCAGLLEVPSGANGRGLREAGVLPNAGPGLSELPRSGRDYRRIGEALAAGDLSALILLHGDPMLDADDGELWERALEKASTVIAHASVLTPGVREHATVVFPAESYAEKEGTVTHPDSRLQRLRRSIARQGETRAEWQLLAEIAGQLLEIDERPPMVVGSMVSRQLFADVPFYNGLTLDEIGGRGVRWTERPEASAWPAGDSAPFTVEPAPPAASPNGLLRLGTFRSIWASPEVQASPALAFLHPTQRVEISPADAQRLGIGHGQKVTVGGEGRAVTGTAWIREGAPEGTVFLENAIDEDSASMIEGPLVEVRRS
jgi:NADH-quinone oxidoreductase subunit G